MLTWLFERKMFSPTISDPSTFLWKKKTTFFIKKKMNFDEYSRRKIGIAKLIFTPSIKYKFTYSTFLTAEDKQIWHNFINILLCSIIIIK